MSNDNNNNNRFSPETNIMMIQTISDIKSKFDRMNTNQERAKFTVDQIIHISAMSSVTAYNEMKSQKAIQYILGFISGIAFSFIIYSLATLL